MSEREIVAILCPIPGRLGDKSMARIVWNDGVTEDIDRAEADRRGVGVVMESRQYASDISEARRTTMRLAAIRKETQ